jgi:transcriptional regulator with XRE-family HTH domain
MKRKSGYLTLAEFMDRFSARERAEIEANARKLAAEMTTFAKLRKARKLTQVELAKRLGIAQENVSRLENRSDMLVSTLRGYVRAMGGDLRLVALFPRKSAIEVTFQDLRDPMEDLETRRRARRHGPAKSRANKRRAVKRTSKAGRVAA